MSWIIPWNGAEVDFDPFDLTGRELSEIKRVAGLTFEGILDGIRSLDGEATRALFWAVDCRTQPDLRYADYDGPTVRLITTHLAALNLDDLDVALGKGPTPGTDGSPSSPSGLDTPGPSTTP